MKILYHHRTLADGAEGTHIAEMVAAFRALGHDVCVSGLAVSPRGATRGVLAGLRSRLPQAGLELASLSANLAEYAEARRVLARFRPDFVYKRHARFDVAMVAAARALGVPTVLEVNCLFSVAEYRRFEPLAFERLARRCERRVLNDASVVVAVSTPLGRQVSALAGTAAVILPNGANPEMFRVRDGAAQAVRARHGLTGAVTVGWAGIVREWHGLDLLIDAVAGIPDVRLLIVGDGPALPEVRRRIASREMTGRTAVVGRVPHAVMPDYVAAMDIAVVAADRTGIASPMKLLEYMAMERAVVAPRLDNMRDLVDDEVDGVLFSPGDAGALRAQITRLAGNAALRRELGQHARRKIERERNWRRNAEEVLTLLTARRAVSLRGAEVPVH